jgi:hypothetical protein
MHYPCYPVGNVVVNVLPLHHFYHIEELLVDAHDATVFFDMIYFGSFSQRAYLKGV